MPEPRPYRVAVVVPYPTATRWIRRSLEAMAHVPGVVVRVLVTNPSSARDAGVSSSHVIRTYFAWDHRCFGSDRCAYGDDGIGDLFPDVERVTLPADASDRLSTYRAAVARHEIDVTIDFGSTLDVAASGSLPRLGVWQLTHDGMASAAAAAAAVLGGRSTITTRLVVDGDARRVICQSISGADDLSVTRALDRVLWKSAAIVPRALRLLVTVGESILETARPSLPADDAAQLSSGALAQYLPGLVKRGVRRLLEREPGPSQWMLLHARAETDGAVRIVDEIVPGPGVFWADPCVVEHDGRRLVFFEEFSRQNGRGHIAVSELDEKGRWIASRPILERPYHLSYPLVFRYGGDWFLLPESSANRTIELYRCERFPDRWAPASVIMRDVCAVDSTIVEQAGRWWLFTNLAEFEGSSMHDDLFAFWTDDLLRGVWRPHARNPIVSDVRTARCAGHFFSQAGRLIRPSQDCSRAYGWAVHLNEVQVLTERDYREVSIAALEPRWDRRIVGTHTWSQVGEDVWLDARLKRSRLAGAWKTRLPPGGLSVTLRSGEPCGHS